MQITSYVNNVHPDDHGELYKVLEQFVAAAVPLWEMCLYTCLTPDGCFVGRETDTSTYVLLGRLYRQTNSLLPCFVFSPQVMVRNSHLLQQHHESPICL